MECTEDGKTVTATRKKKKKRGKSEEFETYFSKLKNAVLMARSQADGRDSAFLTKV